MGALRGGGGDELACAIRGGLSSADGKMCAALGGTDVAVNMVEK